MATVLSMQPKVLLLDEPTNDLDPETRERCVELLNTLPQAMCIVSHDWDFLERTVNRLVVMKEGRLRHSDTAALHRHVHAHAAGESRTRAPPCKVSSRNIPPISRQINRQDLDHTPSQIVMYSL